MTRARLPNRRRQILEDVDLMIGTASFPHTIGVGMYDDGRPGEVFIKARRRGEFLNLTNDDFGVLLSSLLQRGASPVELAHLVGRIGGEQPATIAGVVADLLCRRFKQIMEDAP